MKKPFQIFLLLLFSLSVFGQEKKDTVAKKKESRWSVGISGGLLLTNPAWIWDNNGSYSLTQKLVPKYCIDISIGRSLFKDSKLILGGSYDVLSYKFEYYLQNQEVKDRDLFNYSFLNFYFLFQPGVKFNKFNCNVGLGPQLGFLIKNTREDTHESYNGSTSNNTSEMFVENHMVFEIRLEVGCNYFLNKEFSIFASSTFITAFNKIVEIKNIPISGTSSQSQYKPSYFKLNAGLIYHFQRKP